MAQSQSQAQQRSSFQHPPQSFAPSFQQPNGRAQFSPQSPQYPAPHASPSPQPQFSHSYGSQAPPAKRQRMSPDAPSSFSQSVQSPQAGSPVSNPINGNTTQTNSRQGLMPPPQQPMIKREDRDNDNAFLRGGSMDFDREAGALSSLIGSPNTPVPLTAAQGPFDPNALPNSSGPTASAPAHSVSQEEKERRDHQRQDWDESRHSQSELWDPFLFVGTVNDKIKSAAHRVNLLEPQAGVLVNTQKNQPPPVVRVNGMEGATRVIRDGQSILDTREKADRLNELVKLLSLSSKTRMINLIQAAARLALERRQHSQGRVPNDWSDVAVKTRPTGAEEQNVPSPTASTGMKRTHSQANSEGNHLAQSPTPHPAVAEFEKFSSREIKAELARQAKRRKRNDDTNAQESEAAAAAQEEAITAAALEADKKTTKKERKMAENKISEQQQHASTNEAARMATANIFGGKKKQYSWMTGGGPGGGGGTGGGGPGAGALSRTPSATITPRSVSVAVPPRDKALQARKGPQIGHFDESTELGIQGRDLLLVLESDGRAARSYVRGSNVVDDSMPQTSS